jgi:hypothetical protein
VTFRKHTPESTERMIARKVTPRWGKRMTTSRPAAPPVGEVRSYSKEVIDLVNEYNRVLEAIHILHERTVCKEAGRVDIENKLKSLGYVIAA